MGEIQGQTMVTFKMINDHTPFQLIVWYFLLLLSNVAFIDLKAGQ